MVVRVDFTGRVNIAKPFLSGNTVGHQLFLQRTRLNQQHADEQQHLVKIKGSGNNDAQTKPDPKNLNRPANPSSSSGNLNLSRRKTN